MSDYPRHPVDYTVERRDRPTPVSRSFLLGLGLGLLIMIPIWTFVLFLAFTLF